MEKRAAKVEKEKKAKDAQSKSRTLMAKFFSKPQGLPAFSPNGREMNTRSPALSDFERIFKSFSLKKGCILAPVNYFETPRKRKGKEVAVLNSSGIICLDSDDEEEGFGDVIEKDLRSGSADVSSMTAQGILVFMISRDIADPSCSERLSNILTSLPSSLDRSRLPRPRWKGSGSDFRIYNPCSIQDVMTKLSEAEIVGDDNEVRTLLNQLQDRALFPAKVLIYHEDARPGYFGTWTRSSKIIGPRRPFGKDVVEFDYNYDSGEDWEEEPIGDVDDVLQDDGEDGDSEEADSDLDDWLVDDDEEPETYQTVQGASPLGFPDFSDMPPPPPKRKAVEPDKKVKKRKVVVPLVPFSKGPCWERRIGEYEYEPFNSYRIQLFNGELINVCTAFIVVILLQTQPFLSIHSHLYQHAPRNIEQVSRTLQSPLLPMQLLLMCQMFLDKSLLLPMPMACLCLIL